jgi:hypothetical protein
MPLVASRANASAKAFGFSAALAGEELGGMVLMTPTSIASTGTGNSSSIGANGSVTFSSCATLSLNGVFTSDYDNYMVVMRRSASAASITLTARLRDSTPADASGTDYTRQYLYASSTSVTAARETAQTSFRFGAASSIQRDGDVVYIYGPNLVQPTAIRNVGVFSNSDADLIDAASTHSLSTAYSGITVIASTGTISGLVSVYGLGG